MSMQPYSDEQLNYFKFASIVFKEFPDALRGIFVYMWDTRVAPSSTIWDDSRLVRNKLQSDVAAKLPMNEPFEKWDCTALFQATLYARTFALPDSTGKKKTLEEMYLKGRKPAPAPFHSAVKSSSGDANETIALAIDQLRLLRNTLCHTSSPQISKVKFDDYVRHAKDAFTALNFSTASLKRIGNLKESDFPTKVVEKLNEEINRLRIEFCLFLQSDVKDEMSEVKYEICEVKQKLNNIEGVLTQTKDTTGLENFVMPCKHKDHNTLPKMSSFQYVKCSTGDMPPANAFRGGFDNGPSYHARGVVEKDNSKKTIPGKVDVDPYGHLLGACIPYGSTENRIDSFEVLTSTPLNISYVKCQAGDKPPENAVLGGYDNGPSYHARGVVDKKKIPGKVGVKDRHLIGACIAYGGKEHRINDFEVMVKVIDDAITHVEFQVDESKILSTTPKVILDELNHNNTLETQTIEFWCNYTAKSNFTFTHQVGASLSAGTTFKCGIPMLAEGGVEVVLTGFHSHTWGKSGSDEKSFTGKFPVTAGPKSTIKCKALVNETILEVPYTVHLKSGKTSGGMWHGTSTWGLKATFEEIRK